MRRRRCKVCGELKSFVYLVQAMNGPDKPMTASLPGWHYRGWGALPICEECWEKVKDRPAMEVVQLVRPKSTDNCPESEKREVIENV
jgi:hypothetical protein